MLLVLILLRYIAWQVWRRKSHRYSVPTCATAGALSGPSFTYEGRPGISRGWCIFRTSKICCQCFPTSFSATFQTYSCRCQVLMATKSWHCQPRVVSRDILLFSLFVLHPRIAYYIRHGIKFSFQLQWHLRVLLFVYKRQKLLISCHSNQITTYKHDQYIKGLLKTRSQYWTKRVGPDLEFYNN